MNKKAQAGIEYLMTYGWALILIVTVIGVLVFIVSTPVSDVTFRSSDPTKLILKGATALAEAVQIKLQNITGGKITITTLTSEQYANLKINGQNPTEADPVEIGAGGEIVLEGNGTTGTITITYRDYAGITRTTTIIGGGGEPNTTPVGTPIAACGTNITVAGAYYLSGPLSASGTCITINTDDVTINCYSNTITGPGSGINNGIAINGDGSTVQNCTITGFWRGIYFTTGTNNDTISGNSVSGNTVGINIEGSGHTISGNTSSNNGTGIWLNLSSGNTVSGNTANGNDSSGISINNANNNTITGNTTNSNYRGIYMPGGTGNIISDNTIIGNTGQDGGIYAVLTEGPNTISGNTVNENYLGIQLYDCNPNTIQDNTINNNTHEGILMADNSSPHTIARNEICGNLGSDFDCGGTENTGTENFFDDISDCVPGWPVFTTHYLYCP